MPQTPPYFVHPTACIDVPCEIGAGSKIWHFCHLMRHCRLGDGCSLGQNVFVAEGVHIGRRTKIQNNVSLYAGIVVEDDVFLGPSCVFTNVVNPRAEVSRQAHYTATVIRRGCTVGANATVVCGVTLGQFSFIGAGAVVTHDVPDYALVTGVPARQCGWMSRHGQRMQAESPGQPLVCPQSGWNYAQAAGALRCLDWPEDRPLPAATPRDPGYLHASRHRDGG